MKKISLVVLYAIIIFFVTILVQKPAPATGEVILGQTTKTSDCVVVNDMPDKDCTPGDIDPRVTQENINSTICVTGYTKTVRPPISVTNKIKFERMAAYGFSDSPSNYELDHLISLELGGDPTSVANLWPESYTSSLDARKKDRVENYLHNEVCKGHIPLATAQDKIAHDWETVYRQLPQ
jgi:hypothetical protein